MSRRSGRRLPFSCSVVLALAACASCATRVPIGGRDLPSFPLTIHLAGSGRVDSSDGTIACGSICSATLPFGTSITLSAKPTDASGFAAWSGACKGSATSCSLTVNGPLDATATFGDAPTTLAIQLAGGGKGVVTSSPKGIDCGAACRATFPRNATVKLTPQAKPGSTFTGWGG